VHFAANSNSRCPEHSSHAGDVKRSVELSCTAISEWSPSINQLNSLPFVWHYNIWYTPGTVKLMTGREEIHPTRRFVVNLHPAFLKPNLRYPVLFLPRHGPSVVLPLYSIKYPSSKEIQKSTTSWFNPRPCLTMESHFKPRTPRHFSATCEIWHLKLVIPVRWVLCTRSCVILR